MWDVIHYLKSQDDLPWLCVVEFNLALFQAEQLGGNPRSFAQMEGLRHSLADIGLADLALSRYPYTWDNKREADENIQVWLEQRKKENEAGPHVARAVTWAVTSTSQPNHPTSFPFPSPLPASPTGAKPCAALGGGGEVLLSLPCHVAVLVIAYLCSPAPPWVSALLCRLQEFWGYRDRSQRGHGRITGRGVAGL